VIPELREATTINIRPAQRSAVICGAAAVAIIYFFDHPSMFFDVARIHVVEKR
jgi:hypothetical protein